MACSPCRNVSVVAIFCICLYGSVSALLPFFSSSLILLHLYYTTDLQGKFFFLSVFVDFLRFFEVVRKVCERLRNWCGCFPVVALTNKRSLCSVSVYCTEIKT